MKLHGKGKELQQCRFKKKKIKIHRISGLERILLITHQFKSNENDAPKKRDLVKLTHVALGRYGCSLMTRIMFV